MLLNLIAIMFILLLTLYLASQGLLTATLVFISSVFASVFAIATMELFSGPVSSWRPDYGRGVTFLLVFMFTFSALRIASDLIVPKNVKLPIWIDRAAGAFVGILAALMVVGSLIVGIELLPVGARYLGYNRFPGDNTMQAVDSSKAPIPGKIAPQYPTWLGAERFVTGIYSLCSGRSMGGSTPFGRVHPDISVEAYGYRHIVEQGAKRTVPPTLVEVPSATIIDDPKEIAALGVAADDQRAVAVRMIVDQGENQNASADSDNFLRVTPTQVRLVTEKGRQVYPVVFMDKGTTPEVINLGTSHMVLDFSVGSKIAMDWIFLIAADDKPAFVEFKQTARIPLAGLAKEGRYVAAAEESYSQRKYRANPAKMELRFVVETPTGAKTAIKNVEVLIVKPASQKRLVQSELTRARDSLESKASDYAAGRGGWGEHLTGKPGVPDGSMLRMGAENARNMNLLPPETAIMWADLVRLMLIGQMTTDGPRNVEALDRFYSDTVVPLIEKLENSPLVTKGKSDEGGVFRTTLAKGDFTYLARVKTADGFFFWSGGVRAEDKAEIKLELSPDKANLKVITKAP